MNNKEYNLPNYNDINKFDYINKINELNCNNNNRSNNNNSNIQIDLPPKYEVQHPYIVMIQTQPRTQPQPLPQLLPQLHNNLTRHHMRLENAIIIMNNCDICCKSCCNCCKTCCECFNAFCKDTYNLCCCNLGCYNKTSPDMRCCGICYIFCPLQKNYYNYTNFKYERCELFYPNINIYCNSPYCVTESSYGLSENDCCYSCCCLPVKLPLFSLCLLGTIFNDIINTIRGTFHNYLF